MVYGWLGEDTWHRRLTADKVLQPHTVSAVGIYYFESEAQPDKFGSVFHSMWWALTTLTTVGYGDTFPITTGGKLLTGVVTLIGIGTVAVPSGLIAAALSEIREKEQEVAEDQ